MKRFFGIFLGFFALYALTAQRDGWAWGDSAEFQAWILDGHSWICGAHFSNAHPLYVAFCRLVASTNYGVNLVSAFFGALSVSGLSLCTRRVGLALVFGLTHMLWWNSCQAEVQTMNLALTVFETFLLLNFLRGGSWGWFAALSFLNGVHLEVHNFALLALPVYAAAFLVRARGRQVLLAVPCLALWALGACGWLLALSTRGVADVLVGDYGAKVAGFWPPNPTLTAFNFALAGLSFFAPLAIWWWGRKDARGESEVVKRTTPWIVALLIVNLLFWVRYFVPDQATFLLPTLSFAYLLVARFELRRDRVLALMAMQVLLPLMAWQVLAQLPRPSWKTRHEGRNDAAYFALPWKVGIAR